ncbi:RHS repeat-associated core domain-containing protein [Thiolapillus sp.]|uniref:RHS repeat-associated core domain-containing protein n=1 Tax=Thiolapillus sp. TaxID=2017437 RepID=UPI003AF7ECCA
MGRSAHGLVYIFGKRAYSYKLSRFLTPDPARSEYSSYLYAKSNPLKFHDKSGEIAVAIVAFFTALIGTSAISASLAGGAGGATAGAVTASATAAGVAAITTGVATGASVAAETVATASAGWAVMATGVESATVGAEAVGLSGGAVAMATAPEEYEMSLMAGTQEIAPLANAQI